MKNPIQKQAKNFKVENMWKTHTCWENCGNWFLSSVLLLLFYNSMCACVERDAHSVLLHRQTKLSLFFELADWGLFFVYFRDEFSLGFSLFTHSITHTTRSKRFVLSHLRAPNIINPDSCELYSTQNNNQQLQKNSKNYKKSSENCWLQWYEVQMKKATLIGMTNRLFNKNDHKYS